MLMREVQLVFEIALESEQDCGGRGSFCVARIAWVGCENVGRGESAEPTEGGSALRIAMDDPELRHEIQGVREKEQCEGEGDVGPSVRLCRLTRSR